ncbi:MAG: CusA/CzcA family heavy metal efflux RND transporter [Saprospiraceae bacterium]|nr:CusA/CzcA family heavy metal efflux RND transporter [Saprospiraceae bacterium]MDW8229859.1 CusA/CzcA family heavy metal efflux RND transporter [Saprospiraceae bacterium]
MLQTVIDFSIKNKLIIGLLVLALVGWGSYQLTRLPIDAVPDITDNQVQVITVSPALGAPDVERFLTFPIEQACSNIPGLKEIRSFSRFGLSVVTIVFDDDTDVYWARQQIAERLQQVQAHIPPGIGTPELAPVTTGLGEIYQYVVRAKPGYESRYDAMALRTIQDWIVRRQLLGTPGVADVSTFGGLLKQYEIAVQPARLQAFGLTIADVYDALERNNQNAGGAYIEKGPNVLFIRTEGLLKSLDDLRDIPLRTLPGGVALRIGDVADVRYGHATRYGAVTYNDEGEAVGAVVMMLKGENSSAVVRRVKERIEQIRKTLPEGVEIEPFLDRTKMVNNAIATVERNLLEGALIVVLVLVFFLGNLRAGLIVASVIPLSMLFAVSLMNAFSVSGNLMSLGAIDFGLIVDGAVIVVEAVMHRLSHNPQFAGIARISREQMDGEVRTSAGRMMNAAVFGQVIILIVYLPILALEGIEGKMFRPMAQTVSFAVLGALLLSVTYVPAMSALFLSKKIRRQRTWSDRLMAFLEQHHQGLLNRALRWPKTVLAIAFAIFGGALVVLTHLGGEFIPELEEGDFAVDTRVLTGSSLQTTIQATQQTAGVLLRHFPEVEKIVTKIGSGEIPTDPMPIEAADMMVILKDKKAWTSARTFDELAEKMGEKLQAIPGVTTGFQYPVQMRFNELMTGARQDVVCKIFGEDLDTLAHCAKRLGELIQRVEGARDLYVERVTGMPQIVVRYRREALARFGLPVSEVNRIVNTAFAGGVAGLVFEGERRFDLVVRLAESERRSVEDVQQLLVPTPAGAQIPLSQVADVRIEEGPNQIQREDAKRRIVVGFNVRGRDVQSIVEDLHRLVEQHLALPPGYYITYGGAFENLQEAERRLAIAVPVALLLIFVLLYFAFGSVSQGVLIFTAIPLSAIGGVAALWLRDMPFSISAGVGFIALFGVSVLNGIVLIAEFNRLRKSGLEDAVEVVRQGTRTRLRPVLMTAAVASLGFLPMAISTGAGAEVQRPLATVVIGGLISAGLLTLVVLPVLYVLWSRWLRRFSPPPAAAVIVVALGLYAHSAVAQPALTLEQALEQALSTHPSLQAANVGVQQAERLMGTAKELPPLEAELELGQINARFFDSRFYVRQGFYLPPVYRSRRDLLGQQKRIAEAEMRQVERELARQVKAAYYAIVVLEEKRRLWREWDSLYAAALIRAEQRLRAGEANVLEKNALETQRLLNAQQYQRIEAEWAAARRQIQQLLGLDALPAPGALLYPLPPLNDTLTAEVHPLLAAQQQRIAAAAAEQRVEQSQLLPVLSLGYTNLSITGWQQDRDRSETYYGPGYRFSTVTVGVQAPLFAQAQRSRIAAAGLQIAREQHQLEATTRAVQTEYQNALLRFRLYDEQLRECREVLEPQQRALMDAADRQRQSGEINYLEWLMLARQTFELRAGCLDLIQLRNEAAFDVEFWR